ADVAGARAAVALAQRLGGALDHMHGEALLRDLDAMREGGTMIVAPSEAKVRADTVLLVGPGVGLSEHPLSQQVLGTTATGGVTSRRIFWLCPGVDPGPADKIAVIGRSLQELPALLALLRARVNGRPVGAAAVSTHVLDGLADALKSARFGVAVWSAARLDALTVAMLCGLVDDLNAATRFSGLPVPPGDNAAGVREVCGWMTGFPVRTAYGRHCPEHDPWRYCAGRLVESGETDCVLWISAYRAVAPAWQGVPPAFVALAPADATFAKPPQVHIAVGAPGRDHSSVEHHALLSSLAVTPATRASEALPVAAAINAIAAHLSTGPA
ncbi:MAG: formylmethanofuran dehydrogenase, partial [Bradyrhizobiaceae bacterium]|nr:formylmethanofuran dehydrogenase [Bradyrhizobiaceae bacterium]